MIIKLKCQTCGAEQETPSDIIGFKCSYCGSPVVNIPNKYRETSILCPDSISVEETLRKIRRFLSSKVGDGYSIHRAFKFCLPIWRGRVKGRFRYKGYRKHTVTKTIKTGKTTTVKVETYYIPVEESIEVDRLIATPGRINKDIYALDEILDNAKRIKKYIELNHMVINGWEPVIPEVSLEEARNLLDDLAEEELVREAEERVDELLDYDAYLEVEQIELLYYPAIEFTYLYKGKRYRGIYDPVVGDVIRCEVPLGRWKRALYALTSYIILGALLAISILYRPTESLTIGHILIAGGAGALGTYTLIKATSSQEVYD